MTEREKIHIAKPFPYLLDANAKILMEILSMIELETGFPFAFVGGFVRDYGERPYNDFDICCFNPHVYQDKMSELGYIELGREDEGDRVPHDLFINPYNPDFYFPIHFIDTHYQQAYAPDSFDFSINEFALKSDMQVYAPTYAWRDKNRKILRLNERVTVTTNVVMRAVRFASKLDYQFDQQTRSRIESFLHSEDTPVTSNRILLGIDKMVEDDVEEKCFNLLCELRFPEIDAFSTLQEFKKHHNDLILSGRAHIDHRHRYDENL